MSATALLAAHYARIGPVVEGPRPGESPGTRTVVPIPEHILPHLANLHQSPVQRQPHWNDPDVSPSADPSHSNLIAEGLSQTGDPLHAKVAQSISNHTNPPFLRDVGENYFVPPGHMMIAEDNFAGVPSTSVDFHYPPGKSVHYTGLPERYARKLAKKKPEKEPSSEQGDDDTFSLADAPTKSKSKTKKKSVSMAEATPDEEEKSEAEAQYGLAPKQAPAQLPPKSFRDSFTGKGGAAGLIKAYQEYLKGQKQVDQPGSEEPRGNLPEGFTTPQEIGAIQRVPGAHPLYIPPTGFQVIEPDNPSDSLAAIVRSAHDSIGRGNPQAAGMVGEYLGERGSGEVAQRASAIALAAFHHHLRGTGSLKIRSYDAPGSNIPVGHAVVRSAALPDNPATQPYEHQLLIHYPQGKILGFRAHPNQNGEYVSHLELWR